MFSILPHSKGALNDMLITAPGTWGAAALRFFVARNFGCAARYGILLSRRGYFLFGQSSFFQKINEEKL
jgi:hypothetical protein